MEFLDPKKQKQYLIRLFIGYALVGMAIILTATILLYYAYGFNVNNDGQVIQNGLIFISSTPNPADIYLNGQKQGSTTNARLLLPAGQYTFMLSRTGYRTWTRAIDIDGGAIVHFDYPVLIPTNLVTTAIKQYATPLGLVSQSLNQRWFLIQSGTFQSPIDMYDLSNPTKAPVALTIPASVFTTTVGSHSLEAVAWADDNRHVLLKDTVTVNGVQSTEYILFDTQDPSDSVNLNTTLGVSPTSTTTTIALRNQKEDGYFIYDPQTQTLSTASLSSPTSVPYLTHVLSYTADGSDNVLYATTDDAPSGSGKAAIKLYQGGQTYTIRDVSLGSSYSLALSQYSGDWYVAAGAPSEGKTYIYKDPAALLGSDADGPLAPIAVLKGIDPSYVSFSPNSRFVIAEQGQQIGVFDAESSEQYVYSLSDTIEAPQAHVTWMDGNHLTYVSGGKAVMLDYDGTNKQVLNTEDPAFGPFFGVNYKYMYSFDVSTTTPTQETLDKTAMLLPQDQ